MSYNIHQCQYLLKSGVSIFSSDELGERESLVWLLCVTHEANEEELERNHKLKCISDIVWKNQVEIQCCPYCGERLVSDLKNERGLSSLFLWVTFIYPLLDVMITILKNYNLKSGFLIPL